MNILIVDDERTACAQIEYIIKKELGDENFNIRCEYNGYTALEATKQFKPDILLTDIRMNKMDGISLSAKMIDLIPDLKIIFVTAYADKETLKHAVKMNIVDFVEKPIIASELVGSLNKAVAMIRESRGNKYSLSKAVNHLVRLNSDKSMIVNELGETLYHKLENSHFICVLIKFIKKEVQISIELLFEQIKQIIKSCNVEALSDIKSSDVIIVLFHGETTHDLNNGVSGAMDAIIDKFKYEYDVFCCKGQPVFGIDKLQTSYEDAAIGLEQSFFKGSTGIVTAYSDTSGSAAKNKVDLCLLSDSLKTDNVENALNILDDYYNSMLNNRYELVDVIKSNYISIVNTIFQYGEKYNIPLMDKFNSNKTIADIISMQRLVELHSLVRKLVIDLFEIKSNVNSTMRISERVKNYIDNNYTDPSLSVSSISDKFKLSASYISNTFNARNGISISAYINNVRINRAKELISSNIKNFNDIANEVGYSSVNYFYRMFKKIEGVTPNEYKNSTND